MSPSTKRLFYCGLCRLVAIRDRDGLQYTLNEAQRICHRIRYQNCDCRGKLCDQCDLPEIGRYQCGSCCAWTRRRAFLMCHLDGSGQEEV